MPDRRIRSLSGLVVLTWMLALPAIPGCGPGGGGDDRNYDIVITLSETPEDLGELTLTVTYQGGGELVGAGAAVDCDVIDGDVDMDADFDDDDVAELDVVITADDPLPEDTDLFRCVFAAGDEPTAGNFDIAVVEAVADDGSDVDEAEVSVVVSSIDESPAQQD